MSDNIPGTETYDDTDWIAVDNIEAIWHAMDEIGRDDLYISQEAPDSPLIAVSFATRPVEMGKFALAAADAGYRIKITMEKVIDGE